MEHGWSNPKAVALIAQGFVGQLPRTSQLTVGAMAVGDELVPIFGAAGVPVSDNVASACATWTGTDQLFVLRWALAMPRVASATVVKTRVEAWLTTATISDAKALIGSSQQALRDAGITPGLPLITRWASGQEPGFGLLALRSRGPTEVSLATNALSAVTATQYVAKATELLAWSDEIQAEDKKTLVTQLVTRLVVMTTADLAETDDLFKALAKGKADVQPLVDVIASKAETAIDSNVLVLWGRVAHELASSFKKHERKLREAVRNRSVALNFLPLTAAEWILKAERPKEDDPLVSAFAARVADAKWESVAETLDDVRGYLNSAAAIRAALISKANSTTDCAAVRKILGEAAKWQDVRGEPRQRYEQELTTIASRCPDANAEIIVLRGRQRTGPDDGGPPDEGTRDS
jgi:hypothetical protein